jgi:hypothetical protein
MTTAVAVMDRDDWRARTDNLAVVDPGGRRVLAIPRDMWCHGLRDRINTAFARGGHSTLKAALAELGYPADHTICVRRAAVERALVGVQVTVPVPGRLEFLYPLEPRARIEDGAKRIAFEPPVETLTGERIHQWLGARREPRGGGSDLARIGRQHTLVRRLLEDGFPFAQVLDDPELVSVSSPHALEDLALVRPDWRFEILHGLHETGIDGKAVLLDHPLGLSTRVWFWMRWQARRGRRYLERRAGRGAAPGARPKP